MPICVFIDSKRVSSFQAPLRAFSDFSTAIHATLFAIWQLAISLSFLFLSQFGAINDELAFIHHQIEAVALECHRYRLKQGYCYRYLPFLVIPLKYSQGLG